jgi:predicted transcriptional regulator of viral defense system
MGNRTRFSIAKSDIVRYFNDSEIKIFSKEDISSILYKNRTFWRLTQNLTTEKFIELLLDGSELKKHKLKFNSLEPTRYSWGQIDIIDLALSIRKTGYMSHYTALAYHGLTEQVPKTIYINVEQSEKSTRPGVLQQSQIDNALANPAKLSNNYAVYNDQTIYLLNGMNTNLLGVEINNEKNIRVTNLERTLIDITIRPEYSGGIYEVLKAFENASENVSINKLVSYLKQLNHIYPYHQCIGFYMMATGKYRTNQLQLIQKLDMPFRFYLSHGIGKRVFSKDWNLYYPANFQF